jgi:hypothetical protein
VIGLGVSGVLLVALTVVATLWASGFFTKRPGNHEIASVRGDGDASAPSRQANTIPAAKAQHEKDLIKNEKDGGKNTTLDPRQTGKGPDATGGGSKKKYTKPELRKLVLGLSRDQLRSTLGPPDEISDNGNYWLYKDIVIGCSAVELWFQKGVVDLITP